MFSVVLLCCLLGAANWTDETPERETVATGQFSLGSPDTRSMMARFTLTRDASDESGDVYELFVHEPYDAVVWRTHPGESHLKGIRQHGLTGFGRVLVIYSTSGASQLRMTVVALTEDGRVEPVFDEVARFGFEFIDISDGKNAICARDGWLSGPMITRVYRVIDGKCMLWRTYETRTQPRIRLEVDGEIVKLDEADQ